MVAISQAREQMERVIELLSEDLRTLRPGRASAQLVEELPVESYGSQMALKQLATIASDDQGNLIVQPWDKAVIGAIEGAIRSSQLGFAVVNQGSSIRLGLPPLSAERRAELAKLVGQKGEAARIQLRQIRGEVHNASSQSRASGIMREDEFARQTKELNELIDEFNQQVKRIVETKERELVAN